MKHITTRAEEYLALIKSGMNTKSEISKALGVNVSSAHNVLDGLVDKGLLHKIDGSRATGEPAIYTYTGVLYRAARVAGGSKEFRKNKVEENAESCAASFDFYLYPFARKA